MNTLESLEFDIKAKSDSRKVDETIAKMEKLNDAVEENSTAFKKLQSSSSSVTYKNIPGEMPMPKIGSSQSLDTSEIDKYRSAFESFMSSASSSANRLKYAMDGIRLDKLSESGEHAKSVLADVNSHVRNIQLDTPIKQTRNWKETFTSLLSSAKSISGGVFNKLKNAVSNVTNGFKKFKTETKKAFGSDTINKIKRFTLALVGARSAFTAVRKAVSSYLAYDTQLSEQIQNDWAVLGSLLAPILEYVISLFTKAVSVIANFIKALTGIDLVARANTKAMKNMGASAKSTLGSLAKFDELNTVDFGKDSGSSELTPLKIEDIEPPMDMIIDKLKSGDWYGLGMEIGMAFNKGLDVINVDGIVEKLQNFAKNFGDLINGLVDGIDWGKLGNTFSTGLIGIIDTFTTFLSTVNWDEMGKQIANFLLNIDWGGIIISILQHIGTFIVSSVELLWGFISQLLSGIWNYVWDWFSNTELGKEIIDMATRIWDAITAIWDNVKPYFEGIWNGIKAVAEPIWNEIVNIFTTAWNIIKSVWDIVSGYFETVWNNIKETFSVVASVLKGDFQGAWDGIKNIWNNVTGYYRDIGNSIKNIFINVATSLITSFKNAWDSIKSVFSSVGSYFTGVFETIRNIFKNVGTTIGDAISSSFKNVVNTVINFVANLINKFIKAINKAIGVINKIPGVEIKKLEEITIPKLATGTNMIEYEGLYHLHKGEAVVPKKYNPALNKDTGSEEVAQRLDTLISIIENTDFSNTVYVGNEKLYSGTVNYIRKKNNMYGTNAIKI